MARYGGASRADLLQTSYCAARKLGSRFSTNRPSNSCSITPTTDGTTSGESEPIAQTPPGTNERLFSQLLRLIILFITAPQRWNASGAPSEYKPLVSAPYRVDDDGIMILGAITSTRDLPIRLPRRLPQSPRLTHQQTMVAVLTSGHRATQFGQRGEPIRRLAIAMDRTPIWLAFRARQWPHRMWQPLRLTLPMSRD